MGDTDLERSIRDRQRSRRRSLGKELKQVRLEAGMSLRDVGRAVGIDPSHLSRVEAGARDLSAASLIAIAAVLGHDVSTRLYPSSGPRVRDHIQVRMLETVMAAAHPRWHARLEVPVYEPVYGVIDIVLQDRLTDDLVSGEGHSALTAVDAQLRWAAQKTDALPSARGWPWTDAPAAPRTCRLLVLRSTAAMRDLVRQLPETFAAAYPASSADARAALVGGDRRWPGDAILWVDIRGAATALRR